MSEKEPIIAIPDEAALTPPEIVVELDRYIIAQEQAKRAVAIALRNRWRRLQVVGDLQEELTPKNIIMIGPTGVGKTEISRRLAKLVRAPFVKVEATKFTEVGYVGRDVESIIRDLAEAAHTIVKEEERDRVREQAGEQAQEQLLDLLIPGQSRSDEPTFNDLDKKDDETQAYEEPRAGASATREKLRKLLEEGRLEERLVEVESFRPVATQMQIMGPQGFGEIEGQIKDMFSNMLPKQREVRKLTVAEARKFLTAEAQEELIDEAKIADLAIKRVEQTGLVFLDEIDKICGTAAGKGPDVSREGVQRDLLPLVEGSTVSTKYGNICTDHILFIASGAFHSTKPSDLMPEFQGRFPIRVELSSLTPEHFIRILTEPKNALTKQYQALLAAEKVEVEFTDDAISELARLTAEVNSRTENIGARRLHTLMEKLLEELSFNAHDLCGQTITINRNYVERQLADIVKDADLSRFVL